MTNNEILESIKNLQKHFDAKIDIIEKNISSISKKCDNIERQIKNSNDQKGGAGGITLINTLTSGEESIKHLNSLTNFENQQDLKETINNNCEIESKYVYKILNSNITIYDYIIELLYVIENNNNSKYIIALPSTKNVLYYWNYEKKSWNKLTKQCLKELFDLFQLKIIQKYQKMLNEDNNLKKTCVESGELIYVDNFEKKYNDFKKDLFARFI